MLADERQRLAHHVVRILLALFSCVTGFYLLDWAVNSGSEEDLSFEMTVAIVLFGCLFFLLFAFICADYIRGGIADFLVRALGGRAQSRQQSQLEIANEKAEAGDINGAITDLKALALKYPRDPKPYIRLIELALHKQNDPDRANALFQRGMTLLRDKRAQNTLEKTYKFLIEKS